MPPAIPDQLNTHSYAPDPSSLSMYRGIILEIDSAKQLYHAENSDQFGGCPHYPAKYCRLSDHTGHWPTLIKYFYRCQSVLKWQLSHQGG